jgi:Fe2+ or Zn2+ uptake regulation protein
MEDPVDELRIRLPEGNEFHVLRHHVIFHGYCPACKTPPAPRKPVRK